MTLVSSRSLPFTSRLRSAGFSLVEVIITLAIVMILTSLVMVRYGSFNSAVLLKNQAYEVALAIREAQVFAISVRSDEVESFREEYGVYFTDSAAAFGATNQQFHFWQDIGPDDPAVFNGPTNDQVLRTITLDNRFRIIDIYVDCTNVDYTTCPTRTINLSISFTRPNFDALLTRGNGDVVQSAHIVIAADNNPSITRAIYINNTGLIAVQ